MKEKRVYAGYVVTEGKLKRHMTEAEAKKECTRLKLLYPDRKYKVTRIEVAEEQIGGKEK